MHSSLDSFLFCDNLLELQGSLSRTPLQALDLWPFPSRDFRTTHDSPAFLIYSLGTMLRFIIILPAFISLSCVVNPKKGQGLSEYSRIFKANYETVWRATQQTMLNYPMNINNMDTGVLQTLFLTGRQRYQPPHIQRDLSNGFQYRIYIKVLKSRSDKRTRVTVSKKVRMQKDFFSEPKDLETDGYEEKILLYRVGREIKIDKILKRAQKKMQENEDEDEDEE